MKRILSLWLLVMTPCVAEPVSFDKQFEVQLCPDGTVLQEPLRGDPVKTMKLVQELYRLAGPKIGSRFVEPCYLLCLGDLRPYAAWNGFMADPQPADDEVIERLNRYLVPRGWSLHPRKADEKRRVDSFSLHSLEGLEKRTRESKLSWVPKYQRSSGWKGYYTWKEQIWANMPDREQGWHRVEGIMLGYPDTAVDHYSELQFGNDARTVDAFIPWSNYYTCGVPIFSLRQQDANESGVVACEQEWSTFLKGAYASNEHRLLAKDPGFQRERQRLVLGDKADSMPGSSPYSEPRRLGLAGYLPWSAALHSGHERYLLQHSAELERAVAEEPDLLEASARLGDPVTGPVLERWVLRGLLDLPQDKARTLTRRFGERHPLALAGIVVRELLHRSTRLETRPDPWFCQLIGSAYVHQHWSEWPESQRKVIRKGIERHPKDPVLERFLKAHPN